MHTHIQHNDLNYFGSTLRNHEHINLHFNELMNSFETYKAINDRRMIEIEKGGNVDPLTTNQLERLDRDIDEKQRVISDLITNDFRPGLSEEGNYKLSTHRASFDAYLRKGEESNIKNFENKYNKNVNTNKSSISDGYLAPKEVDYTLNNMMTNSSPIRAIATIRQISGSSYVKHHAKAGPVAGWVAENDKYQSIPIQLQQMHYQTHELYAMPSASNMMLDDFAINLESWLIEETELVFAEKETEAFVNGDGVKCPKGFMNYNIKNVPGETLECINANTENGTLKLNAVDKLIDLVYALKAGYRQNATWVMSRATQAIVRKIKNSDGNYLWQPPAVAGHKASLLNFPVIEVEYMPQMIPGSTPIAFGDFRKGYLILDRIGMRVLRDPYSQKPYVLFYTTKQVGGGIQDFAAIKMLKII